MATSGYYTDKQLAAHLSVSRVTIWRWTKRDPDFPQPARLGPGCTRWRMADIELWEQTIVGRTMCR